MDATFTQKIHAVPARFWVGIIAVVVAIAVVKIIFSTIQKTSKLITIAVAFITIGITLANWVYNRNEPTWATPFVSKLANSGFLPTKGAYEVNQSKLPDEKRTK